MRIAVITSLKNTVRSRGRTILFVLLLTALSTLLYLGVSLWAESRAQLAAIDEAYTTLGVVEYVAGAYPDAWAADSKRTEMSESFDHAAVANHPAVKSYEPNRETVAYAEGYLRRSGVAPYRKSAILLINGMRFQPSYQIHMGTSIGALYSFDDYSNLILLIDFGDTDFMPRGDRLYALHGTFIKSASSLPCFRVEAFPEFIDNPDNLPPYLDIGTETYGFMESPAEPFKTAAETYRMMNGLVTVYPLDSEESCLAMHQQQISVASGRMFTEEEIETGAPVCILTEFASKLLERQIGDTVDLTYVDYDEGRMHGTIESRTYTVIGTMKVPSDDFHSIYTPSRSIPDAAPALGYTLGQAIVKNDEAATFFHDMLETLPEHCRLTLYDQGYAATAAGVKSLLRTAVYLTAICGAATLGVLILFAFLSVYRQRECVRIMQSLGAGRARTAVYLLTGAILTAILSALLGAWIGSRLSGRISTLVLESIASADLESITYGSANLGALKAFTAETIRVTTPIPVTAVGVPALSALLCWLFADKAIRAAEPRRKKPVRRAAAPKHPVRSSTMPGGALKFAWLSIRRGGWRSLVVPLVTVALLIFLGALSSSLRTSREELSTLAERSEISGTFTDLGGRRVGGLALDYEEVERLLECDAVEEVHTTIGIKYRMLGVSVHADGTETYVPDMELPDTSTIAGMFQMETLVNQTYQQADVFFTNDLPTVPEFYYSTGMQMEFLPGYDLTVFKDDFPENDGRTRITSVMIYDDPGIPATAQEMEEYYRTQNCMVSTDFMREYDVELGDTIKLAMGTNFFSAYVRVVGSFQRNGAMDNIYAPGSSAAGPTYCAASFKLKNATGLESFREFLREYDYSAVGRMQRNRITVLVRDAEYLNSRDRLTRQIGYLELLLPILFTLVSALGFVISYLMMAGRKLELAMMRALGARRSTVFLSYFLEYLLLLLAGAAVAAAVFLVRGSWGSDTLMSTLLFAACFLVGAAVSILRLAKGALLRSLAAEE